jgi:hypothetical protein
MAEVGGPAAAVVEAIAASLVDRGPAAVRWLRALIDSLEGMADACMQKDHAGLEAAADDAVEALSKLDEDD